MTEVVDLHEHNITHVLLNPIKKTWCICNISKNADFLPMYAVSPRI